MIIIRNKTRAEEREKKGGTGISFVLFLITLFFAPLAFGTTETWSMITVELLVALTALLYFFPSCRKKAVCYRIPGFLPLLLLFSWIWLQIIPLPAPLVRILAPDIFQAYQPVLDLPGLSDSDTWIPLTVNRQATLLEGLRLSSYIFFYAVTVQLLTCGRRLLITVKAVGGLAVFIAFLSLIQRITAPDTLLWFRSLSDGKTAFGPWVYKNHYAGFMVMLCPLVLSQFLLHRPILDRTATCREKFLAFFSKDGAAAYLFWGFGSIIILASVFLTQSRGGILSLSLGLLLFIFLTRQQRKTGILSLLILAGSFFIIVSRYSWEPILDRFSYIFNSKTGTVQDDRLLIWADSLKIIADFLFTGSGFGTFIDIFPAYKTLPDNLLYDHAHNDFLELLTDGGLIAGGAALCFILSVLKAGYKQSRFRKETRAVLLTIGAFSGLAGLLVYSFFDFNLHNGANGLYFVFFCALLISAGHTRQYYQSTPTLLLPVSSSRYIKGAVLLSLLVFFCATLFLQGRTVLAEKYYQQARVLASLDSLNAAEKIKKMIGLLNRARNIDPLTGLYNYALANLKKLQKKNGEAISLSAQAVFQQPMNFAYLQQLGLLSVPYDPIRARNFLEIGYKQADQKKLALQPWAEFELSRPEREKGLGRLKKELERNPRLLKSFYPLLTQYQLDQEEVAAVLPERTSVWIAFWDQIKRENKTEQYAFVLERSFDFIGNESELRPRYFIEAARYYIENKKEATAENLLRLGIHHLPNYAPFHILLGEIYLKRKQKGQAAKEYEHALRLDPENKK